MKKELACVLIGALVLASCAGGGGALPASPSVAAAPQIKATALPQSCLLLAVRGPLKPADCGCVETGCAESGFTDEFGDSAEAVEGGLLITGSDSSGGFPTSNLGDDFNSEIAVDGSFTIASVVGYSKMSPTCNESLANLNATFFAFVVGMFALSVPSAKAIITAGKVTFATGTAVGAAGAGGLAGVSAAQVSVNLECSGQGAGQNPSGPLPSDYTPGP